MLSSGQGVDEAVDVSQRQVTERILRIIQREAARRVFERRDFLFAEGGADRDREVASRIQHEATTLGAWL